jgi:integrase
MARKIKSVLDNRTARLKLPIQRKPHAFTTIAPGTALGYRRSHHVSAWVVRCATGRGSYWTTTLVGRPDDHEASDGEHVLTFYEAQDRARQLARGKDTNSSRPGTVAEAIEDYRKDLIARGGNTANARRAKAILSLALLSKPVALLTVRELKRLRDELVAKGDKPASVNRNCRALKAALNLAAAHDPRISNQSAWRIGLAALPDAYHARNTILTDDEVRALIAAAYTEDSALGLLVETAAVTGARVSQLARLEIGDLLDDRSDPRLMMPSSKKGKGRKRIERRPVPITASLAALLRQAAGERPAIKSDTVADSLLLRTDGAPWRPEIADYRRPFICAVERAGLDPTTVTLYALRHSSIVRGLLGGMPIRVVAAQHDTSVPMLEKTYSAHITDHSDAVARRALLDTQPSGANVVSLRGR